MKLHKNYGDVLNFVCWEKRERYYFGLAFEI